MQPKENLPAEPHYSRAHRRRLKTLAVQLEENLEKGNNYRADISRAKLELWRLADNVDDGKHYEKLLKDNIKGKTIVGNKEQIPAISKRLETNIVELQSVPQDTPNLGENEIPLKAVKSSHPIRRTIAASVFLAASMVSATAALNHAALYSRTQIENFSKVKEQVNSEGVFLITENESNDALKELKISDNEISDWGVRHAHAKEYYMFDTIQKTVLRNRAIDRYQKDGGDMNLLPKIIGVFAMSLGAVGGASLMVLKKSEEKY